MILQTVIGDWVRQTKVVTHDTLWKSAITKGVLNEMAVQNNAQLDEGKYADGTNTPEYAPFTIEMKKAQGKIWQHMTFEDTGETRESIRYELDGNEIDIKMNDRFDLLNKYSDEIVGLTDKSKAFIDEEIIENIQEKITPRG